MERGLGSFAASGAAAETTYSSSIEAHFKGAKGTGKRVEGRRLFLPV